MKDIPKEVREEKYGWDTWRQGQEIHCVPTHGLEHDIAIYCWCQPELNYKDEYTFKEVWSHKASQ